MLITNEKGEVYYGLHFMPGVSEHPIQGEPVRYLINEKTAKDMDRSFAGRPVFVEHVDEVDKSVDEVRKTADGWVIESFFNKADGMHWAKFIAVTEKASRAIKNGWKLSNAFHLESKVQGGEWNGVSYDGEIKSAIYDHLAIVKSPRYARSVIYTPEQFKQYNTDKLLELERISNDNGKEPKAMGLYFFKKSKVENSAAVDVAMMSLILPKSKREVTIETLANEMDEMQVKRDAGAADLEGHINVDGTSMSAADLVAKYKEVCAELEALKSKKTDTVENDDEDDSDDDMDSVDNSTVDDKEDKEDKKDVKNSKGADDKPLTQKDFDEAIKRAVAADRADRLRNAKDKGEDVKHKTVDMSQDKVTRGKARYGS